MGEKQPDTKNKQIWWQPAMALFLRMSVWIVAPVIIAIFIGKWFDVKYNTAPWGLFGIMGISFIISIVAIAKIATKEYTKIGKTEEK